jgi:hypothetical protein
MYQRFNPHWRRMSDWYKVKLWTERKFLKPDPLFPIFKMNEQRSGYNGVRGEKESKGSTNTHLQNKIIRKYPDIFTNPILSGSTPENPIRNVTNHPLYNFMFTQKKYMKNGYTEEKAFELTERDFAKVLQKEKFEKSLIEGLATSNRARSLMTEYEQRAEYEARQKIKQIQREEGRYKRYEEDIAQNLEDVNNEKLINLEFKKEQNINNYDPATCKIKIILLLN